MTGNGGAGAGSVELGNPSADSQQAQVGGNSDPGKQAGGEWLSTLSEDNRQYAEKKGWKSLDAQLASYRELETAFSKRGSQQAPNSQQQQQQQGQQPTLPASYTDYEFKLPGEFPKDGFYDKTFADTFKQWAHKAKLTSEQAQTVHDLYVTNMAGLVEQGNTKSAADFAKSVDAAFQDLTKAWGAQDTPGFKRSMELSRRAMENLDPGLKDALKQVGVIGTNDKGQEVVVNSTIFKALAKAGGRMFAEDNIFGAPAQAENPFDVNKPNLTKQGELIKNKPELAKTLIEAAGNKDWSWWIAKNYPTKK